MVFGSIRSQLFFVRLTTNGQIDRCIGMAIENVSAGQVWQLIIVKWERSVAVALVVDCHPRQHIGFVTFNGSLLDRYRC